jgi:uncharacterized protein YkwD
MIFLRISFFSGLVLFFALAPAWGGEGKAIPFQLQQKQQAPLSPKDLNKQVEQAIQDLTNEFREKKKRAPLSYSSILQKAGVDHSADMLKKHYLSHFSPKGKSVVDRVGHYTAIRTDIGENIHTIQSPRGLTDPQTIAGTMLKDWEGSPSHRENLLSKKFTQSGVGCASDGSQIYCTQVFSGPNLPAH